MAALAAVGAASAQSSVTISGSIEVGYGHSPADVTTPGPLKGDRNHLTFSGVEDLGGGNSANFTLQQRFRTTGRAAAYYNSEATDGTGTTKPTAGTYATERNAFEQVAIGLNTKGFGALRVGRFTNVSGLNPYNLMEDSGQGANVQHNYGRLSDQVQYTTPSFAGFDYSAIHASRKNNQNTYVNGVWGFIGGLPVVDNTTTPTVTFRDFVGHVIRYNNGPIYLQANHTTGLLNDKQTLIAGTYAINSQLKLAAGYTKVDGFTAPNGAGTDVVVNDFNKVYLGAEFKTGPWVTAVTYSKASDPIQTAGSLSIGAEKKVGAKVYYSLSKRTTLEVEASNTKDGSATTNGSSYFFGVRHTF